MHKSGIRTTYIYAVMLCTVLASNAQQTSSTQQSYVNPELIKNFTAKLVAYTLSDASVTFLNTALSERLTKSKEFEHLNESYQYLKGAVSYSATTCKKPNNSDYVHALVSEVFLAPIKDVTKQVMSDIPLPADTAAVITTAAGIAESGIIRTTTAHILQKLFSMSYYGLPPMPSPIRYIKVLGASTLATHGGAITPDAAINPLLKKIAPDASNFAKENPFVNSCAKAGGRLLSVCIVSGYTRATDPKTVAYALVTAAYPLVEPQVKKAYATAKTCATSTCNLLCEVYSYAKKGQLAPLAAAHYLNKKLKAPAKNIESAFTTPSQTITAAAPTA